MVAFADVMAGMPEPLPLSADDVIAARGQGRPQLVVLDDHPTGSQSMADIPVLAAWSEDQIEWAMGTDAPAFYIVTNARALGAAAAEDRHLEVISAVLRVARRKKRDVTFVVRSDSTLRGHYPLDADIVVNAVENSSAQSVDAVIIVPAFPEAGRLTISSVHYVIQWEGELEPVGQTRFGREPRFPYRSSDLREWVAEKTRGRYQADTVRTIPLDVVRTSPDAVAAVLLNTHDAQPVVADAVVEEDLRSIAIGVLRAMDVGKRFVFRVAPPFVRALVGQSVRPPMSVADIRAIRTATGAQEGSGLVVVGTPVPFTRRQVRALETRRDIWDVPVLVPALLDSRREAHIDEVVLKALEGLQHGNVLVRLAEMPVDTDAKGDFAIDARVGRAVNEICYRITKAERPAFVVARGGSVMQYVAHGMGVRRAMARGPLLAGTVSLWTPLVGAVKGVPFAVYAGGVGEDESLADVVDKLSGIVPPQRRAHQSAIQQPLGIGRVAVIGLGSRGMPLAQRLGEKFPVTAYDISPLVREEAVGRGVDLAGSAREAAAGADCVVVAVGGAEAVRDAVFGPTGVAQALQPGALVVLTTAVSAVDVRSCGDTLAEQGIHLVDAPVTGGGLQARAGELVCFAAGQHIALAAARPVLEHIAAVVVPAGERVGDGQAMKAVSQLLAAVNLAGVAESLALATSLGLDVETTQRALAASPASSFMLNDRAPRMRESAAGGKPALQNRLAVTAADLSVALEMAREARQATPVAAATEQFLLRAALQLPEECDDSEVIRVVSPRPL